jgi:cytochrome c
VTRATLRAPLVPLLLVAVLVVVAGGCNGDAPEVAFGDAEQGRELFVGYGCGACHQVSGVRAANGRVGPNLDRLHAQRMVAGVLPNTPEFVAAFIQDPQAHAPNSGMPDVGVTPEDAADIAAFLLEAR